MPEVLIPIFGIFMIISIVLGPVWIRSYFTAREREQMQATIRAAIEKGQPLPQEMINALQVVPMERPSGPETDLRRGVVMIAVGLGLLGLAFGLYFGLGAIANERVGAIVGGAVGGAGAIPGLIGIAYLLLFFINRGHGPTSGR